MSPTDFNARITNELLGFLWRQWAQLGVSSGDDAAAHGNWLIDPESLLLFTLRMGRFDPRLFDEVLDWCKTNGDRVSIQRLKALHAALPASETIAAQTIAAVAATLDAHTPSVRWRTLAGGVAPQATVGSAEPIPFFREKNGRPFPVFGRTDDRFLAVGLSRSPVVLRGLSVAPNVHLPALLILKLRTLFGVSPRAEVMAYLLANPSGGAGTRQIAHATGYAPSTISVVLNRLAEGQFLIGAGQSGYDLQHNRWCAFLDTPPNLPSWIDWAHLLPVLATVFEALIGSMASDSPYLRASQMLRMEAVLRDALIGSGLPNPFAVPSQINNVAILFPDRLLRFIQQL